MKNRVVTLLMCAIIALGAVSCYGDLTSVKHISLSCTTSGYVGGGEETEASWSSGEQIQLYRADDWTGAPMSLESGAGTKKATFSGDMTNTRDGYYAVRPRSAAGAVRFNHGGVVDLKVEPNNIFFAEDNSSLVAPQIGEGNRRGLKFESCFGALKFNVDDVSSVSSVQVSIPGYEQGLYGTFSYYFNLGKLVSTDVRYKLLRSYATPVDVSSSHAIYVALPEADYKCVSILVADATTGRRLIYNAENVAVKRGGITNVPASSFVETPVVVGSWHIKSFCGAVASADLYIEFTEDGKFTILQRTEMDGYSKYTGTYTVDTENSILSGVYSDGEPWSNSYKYSLDENLNLVLVNTSLESEVSVYEPSELPSGAGVQSMSRASDVKPL